MRQQQSAFRKVRESKVRLLANEGHTPEEIRKATVHPLFPATDVDHVLEMETKRQENNQQGAIYERAAFVVGILLLGGGILLSMYTDRIWYGAMLIGAISIVRGLAAFTAKE